MTDSRKQAQRATNNTVQQHVAIARNPSYGAYSRAISWLVGICEAALLLRLTARLFAARPSNPVIHLLYTITDPVVRPLHTLDVQQPRFGAVLELSTLATALIILVVGYMLWNKLEHVA